MERAARRNGESHVGWREMELSCGGQETREALPFFNFSWLTTTTHATVHSSPLSLSHRHGARKITSVRTFSDHIRPTHPQQTDGLATSGMFLAGLIMVTRNRYYGLNALSPPLTHNCMLHRMLAWPSLLLGLSAWINQHPLRTRENTTPPIGNLMCALYPSCLTCSPKTFFSPHRFSFTALIVSYLPLLMRASPPAGAKQVPLSP
jgi:hypothetical protein